MSARLTLPTVSPLASVASRPMSLAQISLAGYQELLEHDTELYGLLEAERERQQHSLMMVASSSVAPPSVLSCTGSVFTNLTVEGYPGNRFHAGSEVGDRLEELAIERARTAFDAQEAIVQPHSGSSANVAVLTALMEPGERLLGMDLDSGGHLTHGAKPSITGRHFDAVGYGVGHDNKIDYDALLEQAKEVCPKVIMCGASAYPRHIDFAAFRTIADEVGAYLVADISHIAGLVAAGLHPSPVNHAHVTTTSTYKQLFGPRGGLILLGRDAQAPAPHRAKGDLLSALRRAVFPGVQGTPDLASVAGKARALAIASTPEFAWMMRLIVDDAAAVARVLQERQFWLSTGGTDTHMVVVDLRPEGLTGDRAEQTLQRCNIVTNRNRIPGDTTSVRVTSGLRLGTNGLAARGIGPEQATTVAEIIADVLNELRFLPSDRSPSDRFLARVRGHVREICLTNPISGYQCSIDNSRH